MSDEYPCTVDSVSVVTPNLDGFVRLAIRDDNSLTLYDLTPDQAEALGGELQDAVKERGLWRKLSLTLIRVRRLEAKQ